MLHYHSKNYMLIHLYMWWWGRVENMPTDWMIFSFIYAENLIGLYKDKRHMFSMIYIEMRNFFLEIRCIVYRGFSICQEIFIKVLS